MRNVVTIALLASLSACAGDSGAGRYGAAQGRLATAQERWNEAAAALVEAKERCAEEVSDDCVSRAERLSSELEAAEGERKAAAEEIDATKAAQSRAFQRGFEIMEGEAP